MAHQVLTQTHVGNQLAIVVIEEHDFGDAQERRGCALFGHAQGNQTLRRHVRRITSLIATRDDHIGHPTAGVRPQRHRAAAEELRIIRMRHDHQGALR